MVITPHIIQFLFGAFDKPVGAFKHFLHALFLFALLFAFEKKI